MRNTNHVLLALLLVLCTGIFPVSGQNSRFPLKISANHRYFEDQAGKPFFWQAETPWLILQNLSPQDISTLIGIRVKQGFTVIQVMALPPDPQSGKNVNGNHPFLNLDISKPDTAYFGYLKKGIKIAEKQDVVVLMNTIWKGCCGGDWGKIIIQNGTERCRLYGRFLGTFFKDCPNLLWIQGGDNDPREQTDHYRQIALGILDINPSALQTYHASSGHSSTDMLPAVDHKWLNFNFTYTYFPEKQGVWLHETGFGILPEIYEMNHHEYQKQNDMPFVIGEAQYEGESSKGLDITSADVVRRQAWWAMLSGACGHAYGSWNWKVGPDWRKVEQDSGAWQMRWVKSFFEKVPWYNLIPDTEGKIIVSEAGKYGSDEYLVAASTADHSLIVIYCPPTSTPTSEFTVGSNYINKTAVIRWFDPTTGTFSKAKISFSGNQKGIRILPPGKNASGSTDWVLLIEKK